MFRFYAVLLPVLALFVLAPMQGTADDIEPQKIFSTQSLDAVNVLMAKLSAQDVQDNSSQMSLSDENKPPLNSKRITPTGILVAGKCGSSGYTCTDPFGYCCGNAADGFYCAADVNGC